MTEMNASAESEGFESIYCNYGTIIGAIIVLTISVEALVMLWNSAKRARANDMQMISNAVVLELVNLTCSSIIAFLRGIFFFISVFSSESHFKQIYADAYREENRRGCSQHQMACQFQILICDIII